MKPWNNKKLAKKLCILLSLENKKLLVETYYGFYKIRTWVLCKKKGWFLICASEKSK